MFLGQSSSLLLLVLDLPQSAAIWSWRPVSHSWYWDVSATWTLWFMWVPWFLSLVTVMNLSSAEEVTLGPHESQFHHHVWWFEVLCSFMVLVSSVLIYNAWSGRSEEGPLSERVCPNFWLVLYVLREWVVFMSLPLNVLYFLQLFGLDEGANVVIKKCCVQTTWSIKMQDINCKYNLRPVPSFLVNNFSYMIMRLGNLLSLFYSWKSACRR